MLDNHYFETRMTAGRTVSAFRRRGPALFRVVWPTLKASHRVLRVNLVSGRPNSVPLAREAARLRAARPLVSARSYSAREPSTPIIILPATVEESMPSVTVTNLTPRLVRACFKTT